MVRKRPCTYTNPDTYFNGYPLTANLAFGCYSPAYDNMRFQFQYPEVTMIIDCRCRPPTPEFQAVFKGRALGHIISRSHRYPNPPSYDQDSLDLFFQEMDAAGITTAVAVGRVLPVGIVENDHISDLCVTFPGRVVGIAGIDTTSQVHNPLEEVERCINQLGMKGVILEPGAGAQPVPYDDPSLASIYDLCSQLQIPVFLLTGPWAGPNVAYTHPSSIERVAQQFRHLSIVVAHACWPYVTESIALAMRQRNVYLSPDIYVFHGGGEAYVQELEHQFLQEQFLFATAYPLAPMQEYTHEFLSLPISDVVKEKVLFENAKHLLGL